MKRVSRRTFIKGSVGTVAVGCCCGFLGLLHMEIIQERLERASDPLAEGIANAREMLSAARKSFAGTCIMPPFDHYEVLFDILR